MTVHWGVVATGGIAATFVRDLHLLPDAEVVAVGSRRQETADAFAQEHDVPRAFATYEQLVTDDGVGLAERVTAGAQAVWPLAVTWGAALAARRRRIRS